MSQKIYPTEQILSDGIWPGRKTMVGNVFSSWKEKLTRESTCKYFVFLFLTSTGQQVWAGGHNSPGPSIHQRAKELVQHLTRLPDGSTEPGPALQDFWRRVSVTSDRHGRDTFRKRMWICPVSNHHLIQITWRKLDVFEQHVSVLGRVRQLNLIYIIKESLKIQEKGQNATQLAH